MASAVTRLKTLTAWPEFQKLKRGDIATLLAIAIHVDHDGVGWPSRDTLSRLTGQAPATVSRSTAKLAREGFIHIIRGSRGGRENTYILAGEAATTAPTVVAVAEQKPAAAADPTPQPQSPPSVAPLEPTQPVVAAVPLKFVATPPTPRRKAKPKPQPDKAAASDAPAKPTKAERDAMWDCIVAAFYGDGPLAKSHRSRIGKLVGEFLELGARPDEVRERLNRYKQAWPTATASGEALLKHWHKFGIESDADDTEFVEPTPEFLAGLDAYCAAHGAQQEVA